MPYSDIYSRSYQRTVVTEAIYIDVTLTAASATPTYKTGYTGGYTLGDDGPGGTTLTQVSGAVATVVPAPGGFYIHRPPGHTTNLVFTLVSPNAGDPSQTITVTPVTTGKKKHLSYTGTTWE